MPDTHRRGRACRVDLHGRLAVAVEHEAVRMRLAAEREPRPFGLVCGDRNRRDSADRCRGYFLRQHLAEFLAAEAGVLARHHVDDVLDGVGRHGVRIVVMGIGTGEVALDHRLDVELAYIVALAVAMNPHHADAPLAVSVLDQRHATPPVQQAKTIGGLAPCLLPIMSNVRAIGQAGKALAQRLNHCKAVRAAGISPDQKGRP